MANAQKILALRWRVCVGKAAGLNQISILLDSGDGYLISD
jgi:hypothetical protein